MDSIRKSPTSNDNYKKPILVYRGSCITNDELGPHYYVMKVLDHTKY